MLESSSSCVLSPTSILTSRVDSTLCFRSFGGRGGGTFSDSFSVARLAEAGFSGGESGGVGCRRRLDVAGSLKTSGSSTKILDLVTLVITCFCCSCLFLLFGCCTALLSFSFGGAGDGLLSWKGEKGYSSVVLVGAISNFYTRLTAHTDPLLQWG